MFAKQDARTLSVDFLMVLLTYTAIPLGIAVCCEAV